MKNQKGFTGIEIVVGIAALILSSLWMNAERDANYAEYRANQAETRAIIAEEKLK